MSLTLERIGVPIAIDYKNDLISIVKDEKYGYEEIESDNISPVPRISNHDRECVLVVGKSGSGKSYFSAMYAMQYLKLFDKNIFMFSKHRNDPAYSKLEQSGKLKYLNVNSIPDDDGTMSRLDYFKDSLVIFDDIDQIIDEEVLYKLYGLRNDILENGRKKFIYCIITKHQFPSGKKEKILNVECRSIVFFTNYNKAETDNYLSKQLLLRKKLRNKILSNNDRWVLYCTETPQYCLSENKIYVI